MPTDTTVLINYRCPRCTTTWTDTWSCACNGQCPDCGVKDIEPVDYFDLPKVESGLRRDLAAWTEQHGEAARKEGWGLSHTNLERSDCVRVECFDYPEDDTPQLGGDDAALRKVQEGILASQPHALAARDFLTRYRLRDAAGVVPRPRCFELTLKGYDSTPENDDKVRWIKAPDLDVLQNRSGGNTRMNKDDYFGWNEMDGRKIHHCCLRCGFTPLEGMLDYVLIHGSEAACAICEYPLIDAADPYPDESAGSADTPTPGGGRGGAVPG